MTPPRDPEPRTTRDLYLRIAREADPDWPDAPHPHQIAPCERPRWPLRHWLALFAIEALAVAALIWVRHG